MPVGVFRQKPGHHFNLRQGSYVARPVRGLVRWSGRRQVRLVREIKKQRADIRLGGIPRCERLQVEAKFNEFEDRRRVNCCVIHIMRF